MYANNLKVIFESPLKFPSVCERLWTLSGALIKMNLGYSRLIYLVLINVAY